MTEVYMRTAWVMGYARILIYCADKNTGLVSTTDWQGNVLPLLSPMPPVLPPENPSGVMPLVNDCYLNAGVSLSAVGTYRRRPVTGRGGRKLVPQSYNFDDCEMNVNSLFIDKSFEYVAADFFNMCQTLLLVVRLVNPVYSGNAPNTNDDFTIGFARATHFQITGEEAEVIQARAAFLGELLT